VPDEPALRDACALLARHGVRFAAFHEPDRDSELTALATEPLRGAARAPLRRFPLLADPCCAPATPSTSTAAAGSARASRSPNSPGGSAMSTDSMTTVFRTGFGMYVPCDRATYRKLKRIRHLATFAEAERKRWDRSQRRLPHNRTFKRRRTSGRPVRELVDPARMIFQPFYALHGADSALGLPPDARPARETDLFARFFADYRAARHPAATPAEVVAPTMSPAEIDDLLTQIEVWNVRR
jgi:hypothetical protein